MPISTGYKARATPELLVEQRCPITLSKKAKFETTRLLRSMCAGCRLNQSMQYRPTISGKTVADRKHINIHEDYELCFWSKKFDISQIGPS
jgi:hypothetical protein